MKLFRPVMAALVTSLVLLGGCTGGDDGDGDTAAPGTSTAPRRSVPAKLDEAAKVFAGTSYKFTVTAGEGTFDGGFDPTGNTLATGLSASDQGTTVTVSTLVTGADHYVRVTGLPYPGFDGKTWYRLDANRLRSVASLGITDLRDPTGVQALIAAATRAEQAGERRYTGTADLTGMRTWGPVDQADIGGLRDKAKAVPFEAELDDKGRLVRLKVVVPAHGLTAENTVAAVYKDFGAKVNAAKPADGEVEDAPQEIYQLLGLV